MLDERGRHSSRSAAGPGAGARGAPLLVLLAALACLLPACSSCGRGKTDRRAAPQPVLGGVAFRNLLDEAMRRADPQGAVLVVLWTTGRQPPDALEEMVKRWGTYGLIPVGVCLDLATDGAPERSDGAQGMDDAPGGGNGGGPAGAGPAARETALLRVRAWEKSHKGGFRGLIFEGNTAALTQALAMPRAVPSVTLLSAQGAVLWSREGFDRLADLESMLNVHLGQPSVAGVVHEGRPDREPGKRPSDLSSNARRPEGAAG